jgi:Zn-dependent protease
VAIVFVSILVHELGHAFVQRYFGGNPWITLYSFGGLASCNDCDRSPGSQILISLAGPFAGFLLAAVVVAILFALGRVQSFELDWIPVNWVPFRSQLDLVIAIALLVNIAWGVLNLLPVYPLDGGHVARELFTLQSPRVGIIRSLQLSIGAAVLVAIYALSNEQFYTCVMFGFLAYGSYQALMAYQNHWR